MIWRELMYLQGRALICAIVLMQLRGALPSSGKCFLFAILKCRYAAISFELAYMHCHVRACQASCWSFGTWGILKWKGMCCSMHAYKMCRGSFCLENYSGIIPDLWSSLWRWDMVMIMTQFPFAVSSCSELGFFIFGINYFAAPRTAVVMDVSVNN